MVIASELSKLYVFSNQDTNSFLSFPYLSHIATYSVVSWHVALLVKFIMCLAYTYNISLRFFNYSLQALIFFIGHTVCIYVYHVESLWAVFFGCLVSLLWSCFIFEEFSNFGLFVFRVYFPSSILVLVGHLIGRCPFVLFLLWCCFASYSAYDVSNIFSSLGHAEL